MRKLDLTKLSELIPEVLEQYATNAACARFWMIRRADPTGRAHRDGRSNAIFARSYVSSRYVLDICLYEPLASRYKGTFDETSEQIIVAAASDNTSDSADILHNQHSTCPDCPRDCRKSVSRYGLLRDEG